MNKERKQQRKINDCIHIRPYLDDVDDAVMICDENPEYKTHIVMMGMNNFLVVMHNPRHSCFVCKQVREQDLEKKYIF